MSVVADLRGTIGLLMLLGLGSGCGRTPEPTQPTPQRDAQPPAEALTGEEAPTPGSGRGGGGALTPARPRPYNRVITPEARTVAGLFKAHQIGDRLYFEIPRRELGSEMLVMSRAVAGGQQTGFVGGGGNRVVIWQRDGNRILLRQQSYDIAADSSSAIHRAVSAIRMGPIIASFNVESWGPDSTAVIDVTRLFTTNITEFAAVNNPQADRSFIEHVAAFPENVNVEATQTGTAQGPAVAGGGRGGGAAGAQPTVTVRQMWSMRKLPENPAPRRLHDKRVGFGSITFIDYSRAEHQSKSLRFIRRFRLEKQNPNAELSDPVKPIVFWIDPATPDWLKPWVKSGIEKWEPAYREAGFSNAIVGRYAPEPSEDPDWSPFDARYSIVYWRPSTTQNATGSQVVDPRTGEILKAEVNMYHNVMNLVRNWYFTQVGPLDARAQKLPLSDSLMGALVEYVVAHEVGHAIGFPHNMKASAMYPADSVRSAKFLRRMGGHVATLMDYSRFNYVAQPEDEIPADLLIPGVGPYDRFAVMWGHKPIPGAQTPEEEWRTLDQWSRMQDTIPWFRFTTDDSPNDPASQTEAVGDADAVKSNSLGMKNLERVMGMLLQVAEKPGQDYSLLEELYSNAVAQWGRYNGHVAAVVGAAETQEKYGTGPRFDPVPREKQREAVRYLNRTAFQVPRMFLDPQILRRIEAEGIVGRIRRAQSGVLNSMLSEGRLNRMIEYEAIDRPSESYTVADLLADLRQGVWTELDAGNVRIDVHRRNLQRAYLEAIERTLNPPRPPVGALPVGTIPGSQGPQRFESDVRPVLRGHLVELDRAVQSAISKAADGMTRLHLRDLHMEIEKLLDTKREVTT
jgi:hypothetical protein